MANVWTESLDRKSICIRGWSENTTIDPSDTPDNMAKFLDSLNTALDSTQPGHDETHLRLEPASKSDAGEGGLTLKITCELLGLQPLKWPMHLKKLPSSAIAADLVLPLIQAHLTRNLEVESLIRTLGHKDVVITKLLDKLEAVGTGLEHVFNGLSGKKRISRAAAADKIPGLAPFDRHRWKSGLAYTDDGPSNTESLIEDVLGGGGLQFEPTIEVAESPLLDDWWHQFSGASSVGRPSQKAIPAKETTPPPQVSGVGDDDDDDFQVQSTPPHLTAARKSMASRGKGKPVLDDASTEGDPESPASAKDVPVPPETRKETRPTRRLGALGRKKQSTPPRSPSPKIPSPAKKAPSPNVDDSETASEAEDDGATASLPDDDPPPAPSPSPPPKPVAKKSGLGRIGGAKAKQPVKETSPPTEPEVTEIARPATQNPPKRLGVIGKKKGDAKEPSSAADESRGRARSTKEEAPKPRETSQERADRRREELKRELEKKAAAGPAKKKRKF
ncbi:uncharacterized protein NECHADRAFT_75426 [Fusarium vanettenii 77-13-4]|uniref:Non-homologous end-joining factor 1 n=1 Tax=Fusarium vanettenii (strain ATCC MYA-4622 / CBS 123669 / FGSC 9596 / NRRL 45880 / 77-13-4) TaxID=660122 RepID=C7YIS4_FUSV7|nr:uncharacterized protein NECHADRAFT_75426 [Fusarium vanettenii 77-13-4]EEU48856.1 hypothetical protein NECHADRAFT_75426 [Fusarium vanettenii 77-13-4]